MNLPEPCFVRRTTIKFKNACHVFRIIMITMCCLGTTAISANPLDAPVGDRAGVFRAAVVKIDITPDKPKMLLGYNARQSDGIHDPLFHRIVLLDDGINRFCLVSTDICVISPSEYDHMASLVLQKFGIAPENFWWSVTHTHSAPEVGVPGLPEVFMGERYKHPVDEEYTSFVEQKILEGIEKAEKQLTKAKLGVGWGHSNANMNRRGIDVNGKASLGMDPDGPTDRRIGLIRIDKEDGTPLVLISNYAIHGTTLGSPNLKISADVPGIVSEYVEEKTGVPMLFINGAAGNLAPIYSTYPNPQAAHLSQFRVLLGDRIVEANKTIVTNIEKVQLFAGKTVVETPRKENLGWPADMAAYSRQTADGKNLVRLPVRFLKINSDIAIWSLPVELFCEISNEIRDRSPYAYTFYYGYTNGWLGYFPTAGQFKHGGYEVETVCPYTTAAEQDLKQTVLNYLQGDLRNKITGDPLSVNRPSTIAADEYGVLNLSAEKGKAVGPDIKYMPEWEAFGWITGKDRVEWNAAVEQKGKYAVLLEWSVDDKEAGKSFVLETGKKRLTGAVEKSGSWEIYRTTIIGTMELEPGLQKFVFRAASDFGKGALLDLRQLKLVKVQ